MNARYPVISLLVALLALGSLGDAHGAQYKSVNPKASKIDFNFKQTGSRVYGTFGEFKARLDFDTANIAAAHTEITIKLDSVDAGSQDDRGTGPGGVNGGGFVYTKLDTVAVGVVLKLPKLAAQKRRPEEIIAGLKAHGVLVKNISKMHPLLAQCLRLTVGTPAENAQLLRAFPTVL